MTEPNNRVWIELEPPAREHYAEVGDDRAAKLTRLLARLCAPGDQAPVCRWNEDKRRYQLIYGPMRIETLSEHGQWFDLDYLGREADA